MSNETVTAIPSPGKTTPDHVIAFEVAKHDLVVHTLPADRQCTIANTPAAVRRLLKAEIKHNAQARLGTLLVVCEATGGYERHVLHGAVELGLEVHRAHGARVRHFASYAGARAKSDSIDARLLAQFGRRTENLRRYLPPSAVQLALRALEERRCDLQAMRQAELNRLEHVTHASVRCSLQASIRALTTALAAIAAEITALLRRDEAMARKAALMRSVPGIGAGVTVTVLAHMPELGTLSRGSSAALAGLVPYDDDSGARRGPRHIEAGRAAVRRALYMAALTAVRVCPHLRALAERIRARGKPFKAAIVAVMRKLIVILNAVLTTGQPCHYAKST